MQKYLIIFTVLFSFNCYAVDLISSASLTPAQSVKSTSLNNAIPNSVNTSWSDKAQEILMHALTLTGIHYQYGGSSPETGFDCSGFVRYVFNQATEITLPHSARAISQIGQTIQKEHLQPGDLVFFNTVKSVISHVGIYVGNNQFIHAPSKGASVRLDDMDNSYWASRFNGAQRLDTELKRTN